MISPAELKMILTLPDCHHNPNSDRLARDFLAFFLTFRRLVLRTSSCLSAITHPRALCRSWELPDVPTSLPSVGHCVYAPGPGVFPSRVGSCMHLLSHLHLVAFAGCSDGWCWLQADGAGSVRGCVVRHGRDQRWHHEAHGLRVLHLGLVACHTIKGWGMESTRIPVVLPLPLPSQRMFFEARSRIRRWNIRYRIQASYVFTKLPFVGLWII